MKEDFLHYLWKLKKFDASNLLTSNRESVTILHSGAYLQLAGPDFFNAQIVIGNQKWAGNVAIHVKSSDWYVHHHENDETYSNVILHVVWEHDTAVFRKDHSEIPVLELKPYVSAQTLQNYQSLMRPKSWIFCEKEIGQIDPFILKHWQERLFFERLERKSLPVAQLLENTNFDWEAVLFAMLAKNFGRNTNGEIFLEIAQSIPFAVIRKESNEPENLEALLFGQSDLLDPEKQDRYFSNLKLRFNYLSHKYQIPKLAGVPLQFLKHRPNNFPTVRLSQLANLYAARKQLFSEIIASVSVIMLYQIFGVSVSEYWKTHDQFDKVRLRKEKQLSKSFIDLLIINTVIPLQFAYAKAQGAQGGDAILQLLEQLSPERNTIIDKFSTFNLTVANAFQSQALLQLKNNYCDKGKCLDCAIGIELLKSNPIKV